MIVEKLQEMIHDNAEYISGGLTYILSMVSLNIHLSTYGSTILIKLLSGMISLGFTLMAVVATQHYLYVTFNPSIIGAVVQHNQILVTAIKI